MDAHTLIVPKVQRRRVPPDFRKVDWLDILIYFGWAVAVGLAWILLRDL